MMILPQQSRTNFTLSKNGPFLFIYVLCASQESERVVSREEGIALATEHGCLFLECSAKTRENVEQCFEELALKVRNLEQKKKCSFSISCGMK